jgi:FlaA1/EpsC-like NDP-sugar epimerase
VIKGGDYSALEALARRVVPRLIALGRHQKRAILAAGDIVVLNFAMWLAMSLRLGEFFVPRSWQLFFLLGAAPVIGVATFFYFGLYRLVTRFIGQQGNTLIPVAVGLSVLFWAVLVLLSGIQSTVDGASTVQVVPRSVVILYPILATALVWASRQASGWFLRKGGIELPIHKAEGPRSVLIYGAGVTGVRLHDALRETGQYVTVGFIDPSPTLWGQYIGGLKVFRPERLAGLIRRYDIKEVMLAMPKSQRRERQAAIRQLEPLLVGVRTLPAIEDLASGRVTVNDLRPVEAEDLLGRDPIPPNPSLLARNIAGKSVLVAGAGGTIGSELVRQILSQNPRRLVLLDANEAPLYEIEMEVSGLLKPPNGTMPPEIVVVLGSVQDGGLMREIIQRNGIETIYHAAAFKHVPLVELNAVAGLRNNTFGTAVLAEAAEFCGVELFVLISTDKAVRPTSIMGASKRLAEMILQARAAAGNERTVFTMVRFGNVLDSSGSVVRRFRRQIEARRPVTVTHRDVVRYFMSIPEAAALVIQAGAMATGGDVFVLDMGETVKIDDLAKSMIRLMGLEVRDEEHPDGDIPIQYIGLRPGEKLHEELLLGQNTSPTEHPRILRGHEPYMESAKLVEVLEALSAAVATGNMAEIHATLAAAVEGYNPDGRPSGAGDPKTPAPGSPPS